jgi:hypothetical protein
VCRYTTYHKPVDIAALTVITLAIFATFVALCALLVALFRAHRWAIARAQECAIALEAVEEEAADVIEEVEIKVKGRRQRTREKKVAAREGDVIVEVEPWRLEKIHVVEEELRARIPWWCRRLVSIDV